MPIPKIRIIALITAVFFITPLIIGGFFIFHQANAAIMIPFDTASIAGQAADSYSGDPLADVNARLLIREPIDYYIWQDNGVEYNDCIEPLFEQAGWCYTPSQETITDNAGYYLLTDIDVCDLPPADDWFIDLEFSLAGYNTTTIEAINPICDETLTIDVSLESINPPGSDPVILIPGIMGSWEVKGDWKMDPILRTYDNLIEAMLAREEYDLGQTLFTFAYDWKQSNVLTASLLKQKIDQIKQQTGSSKVDIVAHSMGGLVSRYYIQSNEYEDDVDQLILLATPHMGAPESYLAYEGAYISGGFSKLKEFYLNIQAIKSGYAFNLPGYIREQVLSTGQLLPAYDYLQEKIDDSWQYRMYPVQYPRNTFLENLNTDPALDILKQRVDLTNIYGHAGAESTLSSIKVIPDPNIYDNKWMDGYPEDLDDNFNALVNGNGDGTVPIESLEFLTDVQTVEFTDTDHREIVTKAQQDVIEILTGTRPTEYHSGSWGTARRILFIRPYSPVDIQVIAPDGKIVGKDFETNTEINQIENAFYSGFEDEELEFVVIINPLDGGYQVIARGTADGSYDLGVSYSTDDQTTDSFVYDIPIEQGQKDSFKLSLDAAGQEPVVLEQESITIESTIADINRLYEQGSIKHKKDKKHLVNELQRLSRELKKYDKKIDSLEKLIEKTEADTKLKPKTKQKLLKKYNKRIEKIEKQRGKTITRQLGHMQKRLDKIKKKNGVDEPGYGIINNDLNYLKTNL